MSAYQLKISAININGTGPATEWHHIETYENDLDESQVPGAPGYIRSIFFPFILKFLLLFLFVFTLYLARPSSESISVHWSPPSQQEIKVNKRV